MLGLNAVVAVVKRHTTEKPWWVDLTPQLLKYGLSSLVGVYLVYWLTTDVSAQLKSLNVEMAKHAAATTSIATSIKTQTDTNESFQHVMVELQEQTCENSARLVNDRELCSAILRNWEKNK